MAYKTAEALGMAVTAAARASAMDTSRAVQGFYFHRLLCRVFSRSDSPFLLKGGQSILARVPTARTTRDIDLLSETGDLEEALEELLALASIDLGDFVTFEFAGTKPIKSEDEYRSGMKVFFTPMFGARRMRRLSVDLVVGQTPTGKPETLTPADRIIVDGVVVFDYRMYPAANSIADKLCATFETHNGHPSSRVKDLVDLLVYATTMDVEGDDLCQWSFLEARVRGLELPERFGVPHSWHANYRESYRKMVGETGLPEELADMRAGERLAARMLDSVLDRSAEGRTWSHRLLSWQDKSQ